jgi:hypothetical protein
MSDEVRGGNYRSLDHISRCGGHNRCGRGVDVNNIGERITIIALILAIGGCDSDDAVGHNSRVFDRCQDRSSGSRRTQHDGY